jgi:GT2 family glycosyltransferase
VPDVSVVAVSWNTAHCLPAAIDSVALGSDPLLVEVIVVDNGSHDDSVGVLETRGGVDLVALGQNTGFTRAANVGASRARGQYVLFLNPDVVAPTGGLNRVVAALEDRPDAWAATPRFTNPDGTAQPFWRRRPGAITLGLAFTHRGRRIDRLIGGRARRYLEYADLEEDGTPVEIDSAGAAFLLVRRADFETAGRFDERYFNFFQDTALQRRMAREGRPLLGVRDVAVTHQLGVTFRTLPPTQVHGQLLYAARQYFADEPWFRRWAVEVAIRLEVVGPGDHRKALRAGALAPLVRRRSLTPG